MNKKIFLNTKQSHKNNKKSSLNAFTFAELMISLVIIAVITALLYPTISEISPNNNKQLFRSAYKTIEMVVSEIMANNENITPAQNQTTALCNAFKSRLNTVNFTITDAANNAQSSTGCDNISKDTLQTSNGMRWYFANYDDALKKHTIYVDVNASNNRITSVDCNGNACNEIANIPTTKWPTGCFRTNNTTVRDTFRIDINSNGKIEINDTIAAEHLKDTTD